MYMKTIVSDTQNIAACGLYCGACRKFLAEKCPGCKQNENGFTSGNTDSVWLSQYGVCMNFAEIYEFLCYGRNDTRVYHTVAEGETLQGVGYNYNNLSPLQLMMLIRIFWITVLMRMTFKRSQMHLLS